MTDPTPDLESIRKRAENLEAINDGSDIDDAMDAYYQAVEDRRVLLAAIATAKDEERAAVVAETRHRAAEWESVGVKDDARVLREHADAIESNRHRGKA